MEVLMSANNNTSSIPGFFARVLGNDAARKGVAGAIAGLLVAVVSEALFPKS